MSMHTFIAGLTLICRSTTTSSCQYAALVQVKGGMIPCEPAFRQQAGILLQTCNIFLHWTYHTSALLLLLTSSTRTFPVHTVCLSVSVIKFPFFFRVLKVANQYCIYRITLFLLGIVSLHWIKLHQIQNWHKYPLPLKWLVSHLPLQTSCICICSHCLFFLNIIL